MQRLVDLPALCQSLGMTYRHPMLVTRWTCFDALVCGNIVCETQVMNSLKA